VTSDGFFACLQRIRAETGWPSLPARAVRPGWRRGIGLACSSHISGLLASGAIVRVLEDGSIILNTGAVDIGQGCDTVLAQMLADSLQVPLSAITVTAPDTDGSPYNWGTTASRVTYMVGRAVVQAAAEVEKVLKKHAGDMLLEVGFQAIALRSTWISGGPIIGHDSQLYDSQAVDPKRCVASGVPFPQIGVFGFAALVCDLDIEEATGKVAVADAWSACDVGRAINPGQVEGQIEGGFVQGLGYSLCEEVVWDGARIANPTLMDYKIPTFLDAPERIHPLIVEDPEPDGPFGAKGIGEISICAVAPAVANAVAQATGARLHHLPLTPERVLSALISVEA
jgi:CO/xanthine dehydrogenase Mo-binding subunit